MRCLVHARAGGSEEAVAACAVCGMGLCEEHLIEREVPVVREVSGWAGKTAMMILCERCAKAQPTA